MPKKVCGNLNSIIQSSNPHGRSPFTGKIGLRPISHKHKQQQRKEQRRNQMNQLRKNKREEVLEQKRKLGGQNTAPFLVCLLPMHEQIDPMSALEILKSCDSELVVENSPSGIVYINLPRFKQRFAFVTPPVGRGNELIALDYLKVCDTTLLLTTAAFGDDEIFDRWGQRIFNMMSAQGIPTPVVALMDLESINPLFHFWEVPYSTIAYFEICAQYNSC